MIRPLFWRVRFTQLYSKTAKCSWSSAWHRSKDALAYWGWAAMPSVVAEVEKNSNQYKLRRKSYDTIQTK